MKKQVVTDERVVSQKRIVASGAFQIVMIGLLVSVLVQQYYFKAPFSQYIVEMIIFLFGTAYILIGNILVGNDVFSSKLSGQKIIIINSLITGLVVAIVNSYLNKDLFKLGTGIGWAGILVTFIAATIFSFLTFELLYIFNKKKQEKMESELFDDKD